MATYFILKVRQKDLKHSTDMLRYDIAFEIQKAGDTYEIHSLGYTPERWRSFGVSPENIQVSQVRITEKQRGAYVSQSSGFIRGIRFAQAFLFENPQGRLVEG